MRSLLAGLLDRALPPTRPDESFFSAGPVHPASRPAPQPLRRLTPVPPPRGANVRPGTRRHRQA